MNYWSASSEGRNYVILIEIQEIHVMQIHHFDQQNDILVWKWLLCEHALYIATLLVIPNWPFFCKFL